MRHDRRIIGGIIGHSHHLKWLVQMLQAINKLSPCVMYSKQSFMTMHKSLHRWLQEGLGRKAFTLSSRRLLLISFRPKDKIFCFAHLWWCKWIGIQYLQWVFTLISLDRSFHLQCYLWANWLAYQNVLSKHVDTSEIVIFLHGYGFKPQASSWLVIFLGIYDLPMSTYSWYEELQPWSLRMGHFQHTWLP